MRNASFMAGVVTGAVVGAAVGMIVDPIKDKQSKTMKRNASRAFRTLGSVIDGIVDIRFN